MPTTSINRTNSSASGTTWTVSCWVKQCQSTGDGGIWQFYQNGSNVVSLYSNPTVKFRSYLSGGYSYGDLTLNVKKRDPNAWSHYVAVCDTTNSTAEDRWRLYINGERVDDNSALVSAKTNPSDSYSMGAVVSGDFNLGAYFNNFSNHNYAHVHYCDGYAYAASDFGSTDATTGEWKPNTSPSVTYGTNGFFLKFANRTSLLTDSSSNGHTDFNLSGSGNPTQTIDNPSNNYCIWNILHAQTGGIGTIGNGNTYLATQADNTWRTAYGSISFPGTGKFYCEFKCGNLGNYQSIGIIDVEQQTPANSNFVNNSRAYAYRKTGQKESGGSGSSYGDSWTSYDFLQLAYNNGAIWFGKNGTWQNSATLSEISAGTTTNAAFTGIDTSKHYTIAWEGYHDDMIELNAGNGYFRTTYLGGSATTYNPSTGDTAARFKYEVPTGYQPISTKGLNA